MMKTPTLIVSVGLLLFVVRRGSTQSSPMFSPSPIVQSSPMVSTTRPMVSQSGPMISSSDAPTVAPVSPSAPAIDPNQTSTAVSTMTTKYRRYGVGYGDESVEWDAGTSYNPFKYICRGATIFGKAVGYSNCVVCDSTNKDCDSTNNTKLEKYVYNGYTDCMGFCITVYREDHSNFLSPIGVPRNVTFYRAHFPAALFPFIRNYKGEQRYCHNMITEDAVSPFIMCICDWMSESSVDNGRQSCNNFTIGYTDPRKAKADLDKSAAKDSSSVPLSPFRWIVALGLTLLSSVLPMQIHH